MYCLLNRTILCPENYIAFMNFKTKWVFCLEHLMLQVFKWECVLTIEGVEHRTNAVQDNSVITCLKSAVSTYYIGMSNLSKVWRNDLPETGSKLSQNH